MTFAADLHLHSRWSRATSREAGPRRVPRVGAAQGHLAPRHGRLHAPPMARGHRRQARRARRPARAERPSPRARARGRPAGRHSHQVHAHHGDQLDLQEGRRHAQGPQPRRRADPRRRPAPRRPARRRRQHRLRRPAHPRPRSERSARHAARPLARRVPHPRPHLDAVVLAVRVKVRVRPDRRLLRRPHAARLRPRDGPVLRPADEPALEQPRPVPPRVQLGRTLAGEPRP